ncbi:hypodermin-A-like [Prorops nasuta]|uniref:hypodermin-A-like n=1 Tax=Prorops nasuta TaxID=863751 RepID=UPI0034CF0B20
MTRNKFATLFVVLAVAVIGTLSLKFDRIRGSATTKIAEVPYTAVIFRNGEFLCNGVLIDTDVVATTTNCVKSANKSRVATVRVGSDDMEYGGETYNIVDFKMFKKNNQGKDSKKKNAVLFNFGLLRLEARIKPSTKVSTMYIAAKKPPSNQDVFGVLSGWGRRTNLIQKMNISLLADERCEKLKKFRPEEHHICAFIISDDENSCAGNDGAPVVYNNALIGITTGRGDNPCNKRTPTILTSTYYMKSFINEQLSKFAEDDAKKKAACNC